MFCLSLIWGLINKKAEEIIRRARPNPHPLAPLAVVRGFAWFKSIFARSRRTAMTARLVFDQAFKRYAATHSDCS